MFKYFNARRMLLMLGMFLLMVVGTAAAQDGAVLRVGTNAPVNLDPATGSLDSEILFNRAIYDYLIDVLPDASIVPNLATVWEVSEDGLTYTFTLAEGVTFHDGSVFSSADVVFTFNRLKEVGSSALNLLGEFEVSAPDAQTVMFTTPAINADFLYGVGSRWAFILKDGTTEPNVVAEGDTPYAAFNGTGAFILQNYSAEDRAIFAANPNYWKEGQPALSGVELIFIDDPVAQIDALRSSTVDFIFKVPVEQAEVLNTTEGVNVVQQATSQHPVIRLRSDEGFAGSNPLVRQALKLATNREELNADRLFGLGVVGNNDPISPVYGAFYDNSIEAPAYDPEAARALLTEAGYPDGLTLTLYTPDSLGYPDLATQLQSQWADAGINVDIVVRPENVYYGGEEQEWFNVELGITGYGARPIPQQFLVEAYASTGIYNEAHWSDEELDALITQAGQTIDTAERAAIYSQISAIFAERGPIIIPYFAPMIGAVRSNVQGLEMNPFPGLTDFRQVSISQ